MAIVAQETQLKRLPCGGQVVVLQRCGSDQTLSSVLGAADLLLDEGLLRRLGGGWGLLLEELVDGLLVVSLGLAEAVDSARQGVVPRLACVLVFNHGCLKWNDEKCEIECKKTHLQSI